jgi:catechol-2,3-dioxygenase
MPITRLNHAVLYVRDADRAADFYTEVLGFRRLPMAFRGAAFLQAPGSTNDHDLGLFSIGDLDELERLGAELSARGALVGASDHGTTKSLYAKDPDGNEFEVAWIIPLDQLDDEARSATGVRPLDIAKEKARYGGATRGGLGISWPATT